MTKAAARGKKTPGRRAAGAKSAESAAALEIVAVRLFEAPRESVFEAWTDAKRVARWWGPSGFTNIVQELDARPGGSWRFVLRGPEGIDYRSEIVFAEVVEPERLVYDYVTDPRFRVTATFEEQGAQTKVTMRMLFATAAERDAAVERSGAVEGARQRLQRLAEHLMRRK